MRFLAIVALCFALAEATPVKFKDCGSKYGVIHILNVTPCNSLPCQLSLGSTANFSITFTSNAAANGVYIDLEAVVDGEYPQPAPLPDYNGCDMGVKCPVKAGDVNTLAASVYLEYDFPAEDVALTLEIQKDDLSDIVCAQFNVTLVDSGLHRSPRLPALAPAPAHQAQRHHAIKTITKERVAKEERVMRNGVVVEKERVVEEKDTVLRFRPRP